MGIDGVDHPNEGVEDESTKGAYKGDLAKCPVEAYSLGGRGGGGGTDGEEEGDEV